MENFKKFAFDNMKATRHEISETGDNGDRRRQTWLIDDKGEHKENEHFVVKNEDGSTTITDIDYSIGEYDGQKHKEEHVTITTPDGHRAYISWKSYVNDVLVRNETLRNKYTGTDTDAVQTIDTSTTIWKRGGDIMKSTRRESILRNEFCDAHTFTDINENGEEVYDAYVNMKMPDKTIFVDSNGKMRELIFDDKHRLIQSNTAQSNPGMNWIPSRAISTTTTYDDEKHTVVNIVRTNDYIKTEETIELSATERIEQKTMVAVRNTTKSVHYYKDDSGCTIEAHVFNVGCNHLIITKVLINPEDGIERVDFEATIDWDEAITKDTIKSIVEGYEFTPYDIQAMITYDVDDLGRKHTYTLYK